MAEIVRRRSCGGVLPLGRHASISGSSVVHCASANIAPPLSKGAKRPKTYPVQARTGPSANTATGAGANASGDTSANIVNGLAANASGVNSQNIAEGAFANA